MLQIWLTTQVLSDDSIELIFNQTCLALSHEVVAYHPHYHILSDVGRLKQMDLSQESRLSFLRIARLCKFKLIQCILAKLVCIEISYLWSNLHP